MIVIIISGKDCGPNYDLLESDLPDDLLKEARQRALSRTIPATEHGLIGWSRAKIELHPPSLGLHVFVKEG